MKLTTKRLKRIIKEELDGMVRIEPPPGIEGTERFEYYRDSRGRVHMKPKDGMKRTEPDNEEPEKILGDIHVRLEPNIEILKTTMRKIKQTNPELWDILDDLRRELRLYQNVTFKYRDLGDHR